MICIVYDYHLSYIIYLSYIYIELEVVKILILIMTSIRYYCYGFMNVENLNMDWYYLLITHSIGTISINPSYNIYKSYSMIHRILCSR